MRTTSIKIGEKYGKLTILSNEGRLMTFPKRTIFKCVCDCGNYRFIHAGNLKKSNPSCGCVRKQLARQKGKSKRSEQSYLNLLYGNCKRSAKNRNLKFDLTKIEYKNIITKSCIYCKSKPKNKGLLKVGIEFPTNGIDRVDNTKGYILTNCVPCCKICNTMKLNLTESLFYKHIKKIAKAKGWV